MSIHAQLPEEVQVYEVGPRDGLQNEKQNIPTEAKVRFIDLLSAAGLPVIEVTSFVRPGSIPQLADSEEVVKRIKTTAGIRYTALVPNERGLARVTGLFESKSGDGALPLQGIAVFTAASETFSRKNTNASIAETFERFEPVISSARSAGLWVRGYVSTAFGCPYEGDVPARAVTEVASRLLELGVEEVAVSDTIGVATPAQVEEIIGAVADVTGIERIALHFHDTRGTALANVLAGLLLGVTTFDSSAGGLGGCPYAPGAAGNLATEDLVYMLHGLGIRTGINLEKVVEASKYLSVIRGQAPASRYFQAAIS